MRSSSPFGQAGLPAPLSPGQRLTICAQVAGALRHVAEVTGGQGHGDVAARNVLLTPRLDAKLSISSLSGDVYSSEYATVAGRTLSPRWCSPEAMATTMEGGAGGVSSAAADVWSYGVFTWEVFADACLPYAGYDHATLIRALATCAAPVGHSAGSTATSGSSTTGGGPSLPRLQWPAGSVTSRDVALLVDRCCRIRVEQRPTLAEINSILGAMIVDSAL